MITERNLRKMIREVLAESDRSFLDALSGEKPYADTPYARYLERACAILKAKAEQKAGPVVNNVQEFHMVVGPARRDKSYNSLILRLYAEATWAMPWTERPQKNVAGIAGDYSSTDDYTVGIRDVLGPDVKSSVDEALAQAAREMGVPPVVVDTERQVAYAGRAVGQKGATLYALQYTLKQPEAAPMEYVVKRGDNLGKIAAMFRDQMGMDPDMRNDDVAAEIAEFNGLVDPDSIRPGDKIKIPARR